MATPKEPVLSTADADPERNDSTDRTDSGSPRIRWYRRPRFYVGLLVVAFIGWQLGGLFVAHSYLSADYHRVWPRETPDDRGLVSIDVTIPVPGVRDDRGGPLQLAGWFLPADPAADEFQNGAVVVLTHGFNSAKGKVWTDPSIGYRGSLFDQAAISLVDAGFHVLMFDFRNHGGSGDAGTVSLGLRESVDVMAAVRFAAVELPKTDVPIDPDRIGVRAPSMGAVATILAAAKLDRSGRIKAIWCDSPFATANHAISDFLTYAGVPRLLLPPVKFWLQQLAGVRLDDLRPIDHVAAARCPVVITHSADDTMIDVDHFYRYRDVAAEHDRIETRLYQGVQHHRLWTIPRYLPQQADFFRRTLAAVDIGTKTTESEAETVTAGDVVSPTPERRPTP